MTDNPFSRLPPLCSWPDKARAARWLLLIEEDHSYTFKTTEQRYNPACRLPFGPKP